MGSNDGVDTDVYHHTRAFIYPTLHDRCDG